MSQKKAQAKAPAKSTAATSNNDGIHPSQHKVDVVMTDGTKFQILTTWGKENDVVTLDVDPKNHPAWQDGKTGFINTNNERVTKFKNKFGNFDFVSKKAE